MQSRGEVAVSRKVLKFCRDVHACDLFDKSKLKRWFFAQEKMREVAIRDGVIEGDIVEDTKAGTEDEGWVTLNYTRIMLKMFSIKKCWYRKRY